eukprot:7986856-Pyramimonas_sp.AAC.1
MYARDSKTRTQQQQAYVDRIRKRLSDAQKAEDEALEAHKSAVALTRSLSEDVQKAEELLQHFEELEAKEEAAQRAADADDEDDMTMNDRPEDSFRPGGREEPAPRLAEKPTATEPSPHSAVACLAAMQANNAALTQQVTSLAAQMTAITTALASLPGLQLQGPAPPPAHVQAVPVAVPANGAQPLQAPSGGTLPPQHTAAPGPQPWPAPP